MVDIVEKLRAAARHRLLNPDLALEWKAAAEIERLRDAGFQLWAALGFYRDNMPTEAVERFQELLNEIAQPGQQP